jgi:RND superfamily putative drug exporter
MFGGGVVLTRLAATAAAWPRRLAALALLAFIVLAVFGAPAIGKLSAPQAFNDPASQSALAVSQIQRATGHDAYPEIVALVKAPPSSSEVRHAAAVLRADPAVASITLAPPGATSPLVSRDGQQTLIPAVLRAAASQSDTVKRLTSDFRNESAVLLGGDAVATQQASQQATRDLALAELITFPLLALLAWLIFRGIAALLPLAVGAVTVFATFAALRAVNLVLPLSAFALNLVIGLGLGLAVDYSLLFASRFREQLGRPGADRASALTATLGSAGRTVLFSAVTVAAAMACLTVFPQRFLVSMGIGGAAVALAAAVVTLLLLPPLLYLLAPRLGKVRLAPEGSGRWYALARAVTRRPGRTAAAATLLMLLLAVPALGLHWAGVDASVLPTSQSSRVVADTVASEFPGAGTSPLTVTVTAPAGAGPALASYVGELRATSGVLSVSPPSYASHGTWEINVDGLGDPASGAAQSLVAKVRAQPAPFPVAVGGQAASLADAHAAVAQTLPVALPLLAVLTLLVLWLMTGSVTLPVMALLTNVLTVAAATGVVTFVFQDGHLASLLGSAAQHGVEQNDYLVLAAIVFGLSTDYGVFLLTRIKESRAAGQSDTDAIATGIQRTGAIVSAAALLLAVALAAFLSAKVVFLKELGLGAAVAVLLDAFLVRSALAPAVMRLLGAAAWWSPRPLRRLHERIGLRESPAPVPAPDLFPPERSPA